MGKSTESFEQFEIILNTFFLVLQSLDVFPFLFFPLWSIFNNKSISKALIISVISLHEFVLINNVLKEYNEMKEEIKGW